MSSDRGSRESGAPVKRLRTLLVGNKADAAEALDRFDVLAELLGEDYRRIAVSALTGQGLPELRALLEQWCDDGWIHPLE